MVKVVNKRELGGFKQATPFNIREKIGQHIEGIYGGCTPVESKRFKDKINNLYFVEDEEGTNYSFFGGAALDKRLAEVKVGDWVSITYEGKIQLNSGNSLHQFKVITGEVVDEDKPTKPVKKQPAQPAEDADEEEDGEDTPF